MQMEKSEGSWYDEWVTNMSEEKPHLLW